MFETMGIAWTKDRMRMSLGLGITYLDDDEHCNTWTYQNERQKIEKPPMIARHDANGRTTSMLTTHLPVSSNNCSSNILVLVLLEIKLADKPLTKNGKALTSHPEFPELRLIRRVPNC